MKKTNTTIILIALLVLGSGFSSPKEWYTMDSKEFTIQFPEKPESTVQKVDTEVGKLSIKLSLLDATKIKKEENLVYCIALTDYPKDHIHSDKTDLLSDFFRGVIDGAVGKVEGKLLSEREISIGGFPGREIRTDFKDGMAIIKMQIFLIENRMYMLQTITETSKESNAAAQKFFDSFKLKK